MDEDALKRSTILILDDQDANVRVLMRLLRQDGYTAVHGLTDPTRFEAMLAEVAPDLVLLDLIMPRRDGYAILAQLGQCVAPDAYLPVLVLTADITPEARERALALGARDFLTKPFDATEVRLRIRNLLETRALYRRLEREKQRLEEAVAERTHELEEARLEVLDRLARAAEYRDDQTGKHARRVGDMAALLAAALGLSGQEVDLIAKAAPLHDLGKIGLADMVLLKPGRLGGAEFAAIKEHAEIGAQILAGSRSPVLRLAEEIAFSHHERWDGHGYPLGLAGEAIPLSGRIVAVVDVFDALVSERPYKPAWSADAAIAYLRQQAGIQFDPRCIEAFVTLYESGLLVLPDLAGAVAGPTSAEEPQAVMIRR